MILFSFFIYPIWFLFSRKNVPLSEWIFHPCCYIVGKIEQTLKKMSHFGPPQAYLYSINSMLKLEILSGNLKKIWVWINYHIRRKYKKEKKIIAYRYIHTYLRIILIFNILNLYFQNYQNIYIWNFAPEWSSEESSASYNYGCRQSATALTTMA